MSDETALFKNFGASFKSGDVIFREGEPGMKMFIIQKGKVKICRKIGGKEYIISVLDKGDFFGEMAIVMGNPRTASAIAVAEVDLLSFDRDGFESMIRKNGKIGLNVIDKLCRRLWSANLQIQLLVKKNKKVLIAVNLINSCKGTCEEGAALDLGNFIAELSANLELPLEIVRGLLAEFEREGMIVIEGNSLTPKDSMKLTALAENAFSEQ
jgi:CRP/FNR family transcriptional regulator, cyclic AMP receptor protein